MCWIPTLSTRAAITRSMTEEEEEEYLGFSNRSSALKGDKKGQLQNPLKLIRIESQDVNKAASLGMANMHHVLEI